MLTMAVGLWVPSRMTISSSVRPSSSRRSRAAARSDREEATAPALMRSTYWRWAVSISGLKTVARGAPASTSAPT